MAAAPEIVIPNGVFLKSGDFLRFDKVDELLNRHPWGKGLSTFCRFDPFRPRCLSEAEWGLLLGPHGNNNDHNGAARECIFDFAAAVKRRPNYNPALTRMLAQDPRGLSELALGASIHDVPEYYLGDYPAGTKPATVREVEFLIMRDMGEALLTPEVGRDDARDVVNRAVDVLENKAHPMTQFFKSVEELTHVEAAVQALHSSRRDIDPVVQAHLRWMGTKVISNHMPSLINQSHNHPYVGDFLRDYRNTFTTAFEGTPDWVVAFYEDPDEQQQMFDGFIESGNRWNSYSQQKRFKEVPQRPKFVFDSSSRTVSAQQILI